MRLWAHRSPAESKRTRTDAAPTELGGPCSTCGYKHGAPYGAFTWPTIFSAPRTIRVRRSVRRFRLSLSKRWRMVSCSSKFHLQEGESVRWYPNVLDSTSI